MSMRMVCDRCGHVKDKDDIFSHVIYKHGIGRDVIDEYDICAVCAEQFERFTNGCDVEEEDHYKDSKTCDVVIHKLANGHYAIENAPNESTNPEEVHHCGTCEHQWSTKGDCPRMNKKRLMGGIGCAPDMIACDQWEPISDKNHDMDKEDRRCGTCKFKRSPCNEDPCRTCFSNAEKGNDYSYRYFSISHSK